LFTVTNRYTLHHFQDTVTYWPKIAKLYPLYNVFNAPFGVIPSEFRNDFYSKKEAKLSLG